MGGQDSPLMDDDAVCQQVQVETMKLTAMLHHLKMTLDEVRRL